jgi:hypothetical protein
MDDISFDRLTSRLSQFISRRGLVGASGLLALGIPDLIAARKKKRKRRKNRSKNKNVAFNDFGCVSVGGFCQNGGQCCSGICQGQKGKRTCREHDAGNCQSDQDSCLDTLIYCTTTTDATGHCTITTGGASYCAGATRCFDCARDADCVPYCGPQAACIACADCVAINGEETACVGPSGTSCTIPK